MARSFNELRSRMTPESQARSRKIAESELALMSLHELRKESRKTQAEVADGMGVGQGTISKIEQASNLSLGTLSSYVEQLGGTLEMRANFPGRSVILTVQQEKTTH